MATNQQQKPPQHKIVRVGCGAGYQGDRVPPALKLINEAKLDYLVLECLAERTLTDSIRRMKNGGRGYDPRLREWLSQLLPAAHRNRVTVITNMGAADPRGAGEEALEIAKQLGIVIRIVVVCEVVEHTTTTESQNKKTTTTAAAAAPKLIAIPSSNGFSVSSDSVNNDDDENWEVGCTYLGADSIIDALKLNADLVIAGRVADPSLFVAPIAYTFGWDLKKDFDLIAQATLAGHLLECGCHLTGGYFAHPMGRNITFDQLANLSLPFCDIDSRGNLVLGKTEGSGGELSERTCKQQLTYEIGDPREYITPDIIVDFTGVEFTSMSDNAVMARGARGTRGPSTLLRLVARNAGFKSWAEISYGGLGCVERAHWASQLVHKWMEDRKKGITHNMMTYLVGYNSLYLPHGSKFTMIPTSLPKTIPATRDPRDTYSNDCWADGYPPEVRLRFDGLFDTREDAEALGMELQGLGLCGPAGGGGFAFGIKKDVRLVRQFIKRELVKWNTFIFLNNDQNININRNNNNNDNNNISRGHYNNNNNNNNSNHHIQIISKEKLILDKKDYQNTVFLTKNGTSVRYMIKDGWKSSTAAIIYSPPPLHHTKTITSLPSRVLLYNIAHSRSGDKGDTANVSVIPYDTGDFYRLTKVITSDWVRTVFRNLTKQSDVTVYQLPGIKSFNIVINFALDGGVCVSRRIDRHGKTLSDLILNQWVDLLPLSSL
ncbi:hypothetical protein DFA_01166 [Cavenderia fasciculata]|uniref:Uncharacterized protein n=1 Tax=Cavenderia fasciculata TaxID=261658 RepID=F4PR85_CACFS|nr:uncharacterized protein DFA_01166 [Cavenderia fasciculata]EGG21285.1 hypothetical protein DFA_01166 [Cavenderia fasciculata]|eukprot:XP_004359135.1 hypothetical protein DFA_01166 [Cavenderia fasciculata]